MRKLASLMSVLLLLAWIPACKGKPARKAVRTPAKKISRQAAVKEEKMVIPSKPEIFKIKKVEYNPAGRRDPFLSIVSLTKQKVQKKRKKSLNPLENYDVADFRLLGVIYDGKDYYASILLPDGKAFTVKKGMKLGLYGGSIIDISPDSLVIREYVMNYKGELRPKDTVLKLRKEEE